MTELFQALARALEALGVAVIVLGTLAAFAKAGLRLARGAPAGYDALRADIGRSILLGLELLVGADIIATVTADLTFETVGTLAIIVLIRTFLSFALATEIEGRLPWQAAARK